MTMSLPPSSIPVDSRALLTYADETQNKEARDDKEMAAKAEQSAFASQVNAAKTSVAQSRKASDERLQAAKDKTSGGLFGAIIGVFLCIVAVACAIFIPGLGVALAAGLIALGAACLGAGSSIGG